jgi:RNA-binding protein
MSLTSKDRKHLKGLAHHLQPVVQMGQKGLTHSVVRQVQQQLETHELIKVRAPGGEAKELAQPLAQEADAELVQVIGRMIVLYRPNPEEPRIQLS